MQAATDAHLPMRVMTAKVRPLKKSESCVLSKQGVDCRSPVPAQHSLHWHCWPVMHSLDDLQSAESTVAHDQACRPGTLRDTFAKQSHSQYWCSLWYPSGMRQ